MDHRHQDVGAEDPGEVAEQLRKDGVSILVVGIGSVSTH